MAEVPPFLWGDAGTFAAPKTYRVPGSGEVQPYTASAFFDGTSAAGVFRPCLTFYSQEGLILARQFPASTVAPGEVCEVTFIPPFGTAASDLPVPVPALDDYVFKNSNTTITGIGSGSQTNLLIQGNPISLDGATRIKVEFFAPGVELTGTPPNNQAIGFELWDGATNKGTMGYVIANTKTAATLLDSGSPVKLETILTPAAGTHTYAVYGWKNVAGGTCTVFANTFVDGAGNLAPMWYRVTKT